MTDYFCGREEQQCCQCCVVSTVFATLVWNAHFCAERKRRILTDRTVDTQKTERSFLPKIGEISGFYTLRQRPASQAKWINRRTVVVHHGWRNDSPGLLDSE